MKWIYPLILLGFTSMAVQASETDDRIESTFENSFVYKTYLADEGIEIESKNGAVKLTGEVYSDIQRQMAQDAAEALPGVTSVDNRIRLDPQSAAADRSDAWLAVQVKNVLMFHRHVNPAETKVYVQDGYVTMYGEVADQRHKELATRYAEDVEGVTGVKNEMEINPSSAHQGGYYHSRSIDDASISAQVRALLAAHHSTGHVNPAVRTNDGVVTLNGTARNADEKEWITRLAEDVHGVKSVNNNMTLDQRQHAAAQAHGESMVGPAGPQGPRGPAGDKGDPGAAGAAGASVTGEAGAKGAAGTAGQRGDTGATGAAGKVVRGAPGVTGAVGAEGAEGIRGAAGEAGRSEVGARGATGATGRAGERGVTGEAGAKGETLVGPTGPAGRAGEAGARGTAGQAGERGATTVGARGATGEAGVGGARGEAGAPGSRGAVGVIGEWTTYRAFWFSTNSLDLQESDKLQIEEIADYAKKNPSLKLGIDGSIPAGSGENNEAWADRRVKVVRDALIDAGVPASRIETGKFHGPETARRGRVEVLLRTGS